jgi:uncharacterized membrane protein YphA (DoxX/SURF4 family)
VGLLLLRGAVGVTAILHGSAALSGNLHPFNGWEMDGWVAAIAAVISGMSLVAGFLTPIGSVLVLVGALAAALANLWQNALTPMLIAVLALTVLLLGPGAFSFDARLFGRREIIIPRPPR